MTQFNQDPQDNVQDVPAAAAADKVQFIQVSATGAESVRLDYNPPVTLGDALTQAEITVRDGMVTTVNGSPVHDLNTLLEPNSAVEILPAVTNG